MFTIIVIAGIEYDFSIQVYWVGPVVGAVTAMFLYETLFVGEHSQDEASGGVREGAAGGTRHPGDTGDGSAGKKSVAPSFIPKIHREQKEKQKQKEKEKEKEISPDDEETK